MLLAYMSSRAIASPPNVLLIYVEDLNCRIGAFGDSFVKTPHIDALARTGMRFDRAYCANPVCMPSRTALLTGLRSDTTQTPDNTAGCFRPRVPDAITMPQLFAKNGYTVTVLGKTFFSHGSDDAATAEVMTRLAPLPPMQSPPSYIERMVAEPREKDALRRMLGRKQTYWGPLDGDDQDMFDGQAASAAVEFLSRQPREPFFFAVGFLRPHLPHVVPKKYFDLYPLASLPDPALTKDHFEASEDVDLGLDHAVNRLERERSTGRLNVPPALANSIRQAYYASVSFVDAQIGKSTESTNRIWPRRRHH